MHDLKALQRALDYATRSLRGKHKTPKEAVQDRRRAHRHPCHATGTGSLVSCGNGQPPSITPDFPVLALDLSHTGASFLVNYDLQSGDVVELLFPIPGAAAKRLRGKLVWARRSGLNAYAAGIEYVEVPQNEPAAS